MDPWAFLCVLSVLSAYSVRNLFLGFEKTYEPKKLVFPEIMLN